MDFIKKIPTPIVGLMLGFFALGNLLQSYSETLRLVLGAIGLVIFVLITIRILTNFDVFKEEMKNPVIASVFPTYSMAMMLGSGYLVPFNKALATVVYYLGIILHIVLILYFTKTFVLGGFNIKQVFASWVIVYVGIAMGGIVAPAFDNQAMGRVFFWFGLISFVILLFLFFKRYFVVGEIPDPVKATSAIITAPGSLCLAAYHNSFPEKNMTLVIVLAIVCQLLFFFVLSQLPKLMAGGFKPAWSSFTFPFVITGIGLKLTNGFLTKAGNAPSWLGALVKAEELLAIIFVLVVFVLYMRLLFAPKTEPKAN